MDWTPAVEAVNPRRWFFAFAAVPLIVHVAAQVYMRRFDGWGAWAAAPLLVPGIGLSVFALIWGVGLSLEARRKGTWDLPLVIATGIGGSVFLFYLVRWGFVSL